MPAILMTLFLSIAVPLTAYADAFAGREEMNGIRFKEYQSFAKQWQLITVRYRTDTGEQRFTYANKAAAKVLMSGKTEYPDGAVFAKVGFATEDDPLFPSSKIPHGEKRFQFMVRDKVKYASTGGWGYALFDREGRTFAEEPSGKAMAC